MSNFGNQDEVIGEIKDIARNGNIADAIALATTYLLKYPENQLLSYTRVRLIALNLPFKLALKEADLHCLKFPDDQSGHALLAWILLRQGKANEALQRLSIAESTIGLNSYGLSLKVEALIALGLRHEATSLFHLSDSINPTSRESVWNEIKLKEPKDEIEMFALSDRLLKAGEARQNIALFQSTWYAARDHFDKANLIIADALIETPNSSALNHRMAEIEFRQGNEEAGVARLKSLFIRDNSDLGAVHVLLSFYLRRFRMGEYLRTVWAAAMAMRRLRLKL